MSLYYVIYGEERISFSVRFVPRLRKRVSIHVMPDSAVQVEAPEGTAIAEVKHAVHQRARWVWQQLQTQRERKRHVLPREYVSGETHFYLGRRHMLKIQPAQGKQSTGVRLWRGRLEVTIAKPDAQAVRRLLDAWYRERASEVFARVMGDLSTRMRLRQAPPLRLLSMRTQWGSCSPKGEVLLNPHLVKAPRACIEYVVAHELCHLKEHNHSERFYRLLGTILNDWAARKSDLDNLAELLLNR